MKEILDDFYYLVDERIRTTNPSGPAQEAFYASLSRPQRALMEQCWDERCELEDRERQRLFYWALRLGITLAAEDTRRP